MKDKLIFKKLNPSQMEWIPWGTTITSLQWSS